MRSLAAYGAALLTVGLLLWGEAALGLTGHAGDYLEAVSSWVGTATSDLNMSSYDIVDTSDNTVGIDDSLLVYDNVDIRGSLTDGVDALSIPDDINITGDISIQGDYRPLACGYGVKWPGSFSLITAGGFSCRYLLLKSTNQVHVAVSGSPTYIGEGDGHLWVKGDTEIGGDSHLVGAVTLYSTLTVPQTERCVEIQAAALATGPTAPSTIVNGTVAGPGFDAAAETLYVSFAVPDDYVATTDLTLRLYITNESGDAFANTETVIFDYDHRKVSAGGSFVGSATNASATYTSTGDADGTRVVMDLNLGTATSGQDVAGSITRDTATDTYSGGALLYRVGACYQSDSIPDSM